MHSFRKLISLLLVAAMLFSLSCESFATYAESTWGDIDDEDDPAPAESGNVLTLPAALEVIEEEAFCGDESIEEVVIPYGATTIGPRAFAYSGLRRITIPDTVTEIADDAFEGTDGLTIVSAGNCFACDYATEHAISWEGDGSFYCNDQLANLKAARERLSELESIVPEEETFDLMSTEGVTDAEMLAQIEDFNAFQLDMQESYNKYMDGLDELATIFDKMADSVVNSNVQIDKNGASYADDGLRFSVPQELTELIGDDYTIGEVKTLENGDVQTELISNGQSCLLQSSANGITLVEPNGNRRMIRLMAASPSETAFDTVHKVVSDLQNRYSALCLELDGLIEIREKELIEATDRLAKYRKDKEAALTLSKFEQSEAMELCSAKYVASRKATLRALKNASSVFSGFSLILNGFSIAEDIQNYKEMGFISTHGHPTENDASNQQRLELAQDMLRDLDFARCALISHALSSSMSLVLDIADIVSTVSILIPGVGVSAKVTVFAAKNAFKVILGATDMAAGGLASVHVQRVKNADTELHKTVFYSFSGTVVDDNTHVQISGVTVTLDNNRVITTNSSGQFSFSKVSPGKHNIKLEATGYKSAVKTITVTQNETSFDFTLVKDESSLSGVVTDSKTGAALSGVKVTLTTPLDGSFVTYTDASGIYSFTNVPYDTHRLKFEKADYTTQSFNVTMALIGNTKYNARMVPQTDDVEISQDDFDPDFWAWCVKYLDLDFDPVTGKRTEKDGKLSRAEILYFNEIDISYTYWGDQIQFKSLKGIKYFSNLTKLNCSGQVLTSLDLSGCSKLEYLDCRFNPQLTNVNLSGCSALTSLYCDADILPSFDFSSCPSLTYLDCWSGIHLSSLSLNLSGCFRLSSLCFGRSYGSQLTSLDLSSCPTLTYLFCDYGAGGCPMSLNLSDFPALTTLNCYYELTSLTLSGCPALTTLNCDELTSLTLSGCPALTTLDCSCSHLTSLDLSGCSMLTSLNCHEVPLTNLNLSGCSMLTTLNVGYWNDQLTSLDVSGCSALTKLECYDNQLTSLNLSGCSALTYLDCCRNQLTSLDLSDCSALIGLYCYGNQLTSLDLSGCSALTTLNCDELTSLTLSGCPALTTLDCSCSHLTSLDLSGCSMLTYLDCENNQLTSLDLSDCPKLTYLNCENNQITSLNLSKCPELTDEDINCDYGVKIIR